MLWRDLDGAPHLGQAVGSRLSTVTVQACSPRSTLTTFKPAAGDQVIHVFITLAAAYHRKTPAGQRIIGAPHPTSLAPRVNQTHVGGGPTPDKPSVMLSVPADPDSVSSFMIIRVANIQACYELWRSRGAEFITEPMDKRGETCCYIRDPDGYIIEVEQSKPGFAFL
jgi:catechol 2,3-dioxygenase-like lactoylglutathione lyase family enzyme